MSVETSRMKPRSHPELVSVVMPIYNGEATMAEALDSLVDQSFDGAWELIATDNGSTDRSVEVAMGYEDRLPIRMISYTDAQGVSAASNAGTRASRGDFVIWFHQDNVADHDWLAAVSESARKHDAFGGRLVYDRVNDPVVLAWRSQKKDLRTPGGFLPYAVGANLGMWRDVFDAVNGWSEDFHYGGEDVDLSWRIQLAGYTLGYADDAIMHFRFRSDPKAMWHQFVLFGIAWPQMYKIYRSSGMPRSSTIGALKSWAWILVHLPDIWRGPERRGLWVRVTAQRWGRVRGSISARTWFP